MYSSLAQKAAQDRETKTQKENLEVPTSIFQDVTLTPTFVLPHQGGGIGLINQTATQKGDSSLFLINGGEQPSEKGTVPFFTFSVF